VSKGVCDEQIHLLTSHGCLYIFLEIYLFTLIFQPSVSDIPDKPFNDHFCLNADDLYEPGELGKNYFVG
jgi:hypothetical protein